VPLALSTGHQVGLAVTAAVFIAFALASSFLFSRWDPDFPGRGLPAFIVVSFVLFFAMLGAVEVFGVEEEHAAAEGETHTTTTSEEPTTTEGTTTQAGGVGGGGQASLIAQGQQVFSENCAVCHGATGQGGNGGPDLRTQPKAQQVDTAIEQVTNGGGGMPPFGGQLSDAQIRAVATYVVQEIAKK
jgi:mono/diheme cytochrome c family protein